MLMETIPESEKRITFHGAAKYVAELLGTSSPPDASLIWRWAKNGYECKRSKKCIRLEYWRIGRKLITCRRAIDDFVLAVTDADKAEAAQGANENWRKSHDAAVPE